MLNSLNSNEIRIKINKNKQILNDLTKFTNNIQNNKEEMTLLYYDFNGSKSQLSQRINDSNQKVEKKKPAMPPDSQELSKR